MKRKIAFGIFIIIALIQLSIPLSMIVKREMTLRNGLQCRFEVQPVDPYDAFRGRYVNVRVKNEWLSVVDGNQLNWGSKVYILLEKDESGFAKMKGVTRTKPNTPDYIDASVSNIQKNKDEKVEKVQVWLDIDRYYMEEKMAPAAEEAYRNQVNNAYINVRVKSGFAVIEKLYIGSDTIEDYLKKNKQ